MAKSGAEVRVKQLDKIGLFRQFGEDILNELAHVAIIRRIPRDRIVFHLGDVPSYIYHVIQGKIRLSVPLSDGREFIFSDLGPGESFDLAILFTSRGSNMNAASVEDSDLLQIEVSFMARLFNKRPDLALKVIPYLCEATHDAQERVIHGAASALSTRLANTLLRLTQGPHSMATVDRVSSIHISQTDLAAMVPASRAKVNRCLREWERRYLTRYDHGSLTILNRAALESVALGEISFNRSMMHFPRAGASPWHASARQ
ncbi:Crp/Fnr family transcriptional regulator [Mesorhizobium sp.]|uniref:Crp/Fnr family transcriptional regulator n=1 Tax=Mesorhizobium sp. TaxID=1871066 RepID=UPI000FE2FBF8|nr:Crp/Fnr family transcriptional regulator [Mesorhizobium sp.]RWA70977.1 MAG: Crp/Fnr family transcriptional regulator [Mesorhizobium sp.]RWB99307.1 MAG: Crp/Fnr family transcriptional regulator [Mesorhizobium sp.]RWG81689.1 MAG: Crp/Fnr family transcriptional regulator [Mesorhizobium sp.]RWG83958.1 MAG: Crp/Fnr family transcriptional regulator [Mesorhizobium sp.]RWK08165.1 MAG: Crp/Fnr family transcriptional regulator [Mesorhizobium sp.]